MADANAAVVLGWLLPTGNRRLTLYMPHQLWIGELPADHVTILSPCPVEREVLGEIQAHIHDNVLAVRLRTGFKPRFAANYWFRMLWGAIYLAGLLFNAYDLTEAVTTGLFLLIGQPWLANAVERRWEEGEKDIMRKARDLLYDPEVEVVVSPRLAELLAIIETGGGPTAALAALPRLGFPRLTGFYRRTSWSRRWWTPPPTGQGVFWHYEGNIIRTNGGPPPGGD